MKKNDKHINSRKTAYQKKTTMTSVSDQTNYVNSQLHLDSAPDGGKLKTTYYDHLTHNRVIKSGQTAI